MEKLNPHAPIPLYFQLSELIYTKIQTGEYAPGARIPSEHRLAAMFNIGRPTARQATERLVRKGVLVRRRGSGTFVLERQREVDLFSLAGTLSAFREKGISLRTQILRKMGLKRISAAADNPFNGRRAYFFSRLSRAENQPVLIEDIYLDATVFKGIERFDLTGESLSQIVENKYYLRPSGGRQNFSIDFLSGKKAGYLKVTPRTPILTVKRFIDFEAARQAVYAELFCRTDRFVFSQEIGGADHG